MKGFNYNDVREDGRAKCYICGKWVKEYKDISKLVCIKCVDKLEKLNEEILSHVRKQRL